VRRVLKMSISTINSNHTLQLSMLKNRHQRNGIKAIHFYSL